jgi:hypothetical protein
MCATKEIIMTQQTALEAYETKQADIEKLLKQIQAGLLKHDHKASGPGGHNWGHVGDLTDIAATLADLRDRLHSKGEYAEIARSK